MLDLLGDAQAIIDLDPELADGTFELCMAEAQVNSPEVACLLVQPSSGASTGGPVSRAVDWAMSPIHGQSWRATPTTRRPRTSAAGRAAAGLNARVCFLAYLMRHSWEPWSLPVHGNNCRTLRDCPRWTVRGLSCPGRVARLLPARFRALFSRGSPPHCVCRRKTSNSRSLAGVGWWVRQGLNL